MIFFTCRTRTEHFNLLEKISKNSRAYFHFFNGYNETWRNGTKWGRQNQIKIKSKLIKSETRLKVKTRSNAFFR